MGNMYILFVSFMGGLDLCDAGARSLDSRIVSAQYDLLYIGVSDYLGMYAAHTSASEGGAGWLAERLFAAWEYIIVGLI